MKKIFSFIATLTFTTAMTFATPDINVVKEGLNSFVEGLGNTVPANSTMNGVWADAYLGQLLALPPHFGAGLSFGLSKMDISGIKKAAHELGISATDALKDDLVLPTFSFDGAIGGLIIPFDLGINVSYIPESWAFSKNKGLNYDIFAFGVKARFPIIKENLIFPDLSVGLGYSYNKGEFNCNINSNDFNSHLDASYKTNVVTFDAQLSKSLAIVTPYVGFRLLASKTENEWNWTSTISGISLNDDKGSYKPSSMLIGTQIFGGASFNFLIMKFNLNGAYDIKTNIWSAGLSLHVQL